MDKTIVVRDGKAIATIDFENNTLIVRAASQEEAERIADGLMKPVLGNNNWTHNDITMFAVALVEPCTQKHFNQLGYGAGADLLSPDEILPPSKAKRLNIIPPTFEFQAERRRLPKDD